MDVETVSTNTSLDDKTEDFCKNPTRDTLAEWLLCLLKPAVDQLDERPLNSIYNICFLSRWKKNHQ